MPDGAGQIVVLEYAEFPGTRTWNTMNEALTPDEEIVYRELLRLDTEPHQVPPELYEGFLHGLAGSCNLSIHRTGIALEGLNDKGLFDTPNEETPGR